MIVKQVPVLERPIRLAWHRNTCAESAASSAARGAARPRRQADSATATPASDLSETGEKLKDELDALIDEIDEVLEENAEEFVKNYVQRGGQ